MALVIIIVAVLLVAALAVAAGALDGPRRARRRVVVTDPAPDVVVERPSRTVVSERQVVTDRDPLL